MNFSYAYELSVFLILLENTSYLVMNSDFEVLGVYDGHSIELE